MLQVKKPGFGRAFSCVAACDPDLQVCLAGAELARHASGVRRYALVNVSMRKACRASSALQKRESQRIRARPHASTAHAAAAAVFRRAPTADRAPAWRAADRWRTAG